MKVSKILKWVLLGIGLLLWVVFLILPHKYADDPVVNPYVMWVYVLAVVAVLLVIIFLLINVFKSKKSLFRFLGLILGTVVLLAICWLLASDVLAPTSVEHTHGVAKFTDATIILTYILIGATLLSLLVTAVISAIKNR